MWLCRWVVDGLSMLTDQLGSLVRFRVAWLSDLTGNIGSDFTMIIITSRDVAPSPATCILNGLSG